MRLELVSLSPELLPRPSHMRVCAHRCMGSELESMQESCNYIQYRPYHTRFHPARELLAAICHHHRQMLQRTFEHLRERVCLSQQYLHACTSGHTYHRQKIRTVALLYSLLKMKTNFLSRYKYENHQASLSLSHTHKHTHTHTHTHTHIQKHSTSNSFCLFCESLLSLFPTSSAKYFFPRSSSSLDSKCMRLW